MADIEWFVYMVLGVVVWEIMKRIFATKKTS